MHAYFIINQLFDYVPFIHRNREKHASLSALTKNHGDLVEPTIKLLLDSGRHQLHFVCSFETWTSSMQTMAYLFTQTKQ